MNKEDYLRKLNIRLSVYSTPFRKSIMNEIEEQFRKGAEEGLSEEAIIEKIGPIDEVLETVRMMNGDPSRINADGTYRSSERKPKKKNDFSLENFFNQFSSTLDKSFNSLFDIVEDTVKKPSDQIASVERNLFEGLMESHPDWKTLEPKKSILIATEQSDLSVSISKGDKFGYLFTQGLELLVSDGAVLRKFESDTELGFAAVGGAGRLDITVPDDLTSLNISLGKGGLVLDSINCETINAKTTSGEYVIRNVKGKEMNFGTKSGDFDGDDMTCEDIRIMTDSGDIMLGNLKGTVTVKSASGDLTVFSQKEGQLFGSVTSGDVRVESAADTVILNGGSGDMNLKLTAPVPEVQAETGSGDIVCYLRNLECRVTAEAKEFNNMSMLEMVQSGYRTYSGGDGKGTVKLTSKSGDITLR